MNDRDSGARVKAYALNVLEMVAVLHRHGYEQLRIEPCMAPSGLYWRCNITYAANIRSDHGAMIEDWSEDKLALYTSGAENEYFDWTDARSDGPDELAKKFLERFPYVSRSARGRDPEYVAWYLEMLEIARRGEFPVSYDDDVEEPDPRWLPTTAGNDSGLPMPPPPVTGLDG